LGRQDVDPDGLTPLDDCVQILGASSDHLILDVTDYPGPVKVGQPFGFLPDYAALLRASNSQDVSKVYQNPFTE
jgi:predicted amino acid racemase